MAEEEEEKSGKGFLSSFGGGLKRALFEEEKPKPGFGTVRQSSPPKATGPANGSVPAHTPVFTAAGADPEVRKYLDQGITDAARPAFSEFRKLHDSFADVIPDEVSRIKAALKMMEKNGVSLTQLVTDLDECLTVLAKKEQDAVGSSAKNTQQLLSGCDAKQQNLKAAIDAKRAQMEMLAREVSEHEAEAARIKAETDEDVREIDERSRRFSTTVTIYRTELQQTKEKIRLYGQTGVKT